MKQLLVFLFLGIFACSYAAQYNVGDDLFVCEKNCCQGNIGAWNNTTQLCDVDPNFRSEWRTCDDQCFNIAVQHDQQNSRSPSFCGMSSVIFLAGFVLLIKNSISS